MKSFFWIAMTLAWFALALVSAFAALFVPMMFDAPGSESNVRLQAFAVSVLLLPVFCLLGAILPWVFRRRRYSGGLFLLPLVDIASIAVLAQ
jgi:Na+/proline symporter